MRTSAQMPKAAQCWVRGVAYHSARAYMRTAHEALKEGQKLKAVWALERARDRLRKVRMINGVAHHQISRIEKDFERLRQKPTPSKIEKIAKKLDDLGMALARECGIRIR